MEEKLEERLRLEENQRKEEESQQILREEQKRQINQMKEEFRRKSKPMDQKKNCESQTGFTTDSGKGNKTHPPLKKF